MPLLELRLLGLGDLRVAQQLLLRRGLRLPAPPPAARPAPSPPRPGSRARRGTGPASAAPRRGWPATRACTAVRSGRSPSCEGTRLRSASSARICSGPSTGGRAVSRSAPAAQDRPASRSSRPISFSLAPWKTGVLAVKPSSRAHQPRWVSRIWPTFMRLGTPSGLRTMSTGVPSGRNGMSSSGTMRAMMPLLPCRPAILSPTEILRFSATVDLHQLDDARGQLVRLEDVVDLVLRLLLELGALAVGGLDELRGSAR